MRAEEGRADRNIALLAKPARDPERPALGFEVESIAGFDFDRPHAFGDQRIQSPQGRGGEFVFARGAGRADGRENAAAFASDLFVGRARESQLEFMGAIAPVDEVGMTVDEGGGDPAAFAIDEPAGAARGGWKLIFRPREDDPSLARGDRAGLDDPESGRPSTRVARRALRQTVSGRSWSFV